MKRTTQLLIGMVFAAIGFAVHSMFFSAVSAQSAVKFPYVQVMGLMNYPGVGQGIGVVDLRNGNMWMCGGVNCTFAVKLALEDLDQPPVASRR